MKILISGATGFIGSALMKELNLEGNEIYAVIIEQTPQDDRNVHYIRYDGTYNSIADQISPFRPDVIMHLATHFCVRHTISDLDPLVNANIRLGLHLLELSMVLKTGYFINVATYAQRMGGFEYDPQNLYAATKQAFESLLTFYIKANENTKYVTLELFDTYGPGDPRKKFINLAVDACLKDDLFQMSPGEQEIIYLYIDDVVRGFIRCLNLLGSGSINTGDKYCFFTDEILTLNELVKKIGEVHGREMNVQAGYYPYRQREIMKLKQKFPVLPGWKPSVSLMQGIVKMINEKLKNDD